VWEGDRAGEEVAQELDRCAALATKYGCDWLADEISEHAKYARGQPSRLEGYTSFILIVGQNGISRQSQQPGQFTSWLPDLLASLQDVSASPPRRFETPHAAPSRVARPHASSLIPRASRSATCVPTPPVGYSEFLSMRSLVRRGARTAHADLACHRSSRRQVRPPPAG